MQFNYNKAMKSYHSRKVKKWTANYMKGVLPMLKRPGDGTTPQALKDGLFPILKLYVE